MTLLFTEGFDHHGTSNAELVSALSRKWERETGSSYSVTTGRHGGRGLIIPNGGFLLKHFPQTATMFFGFAFKRNGVANAHLVYFYGLGTVQINFFIGETGQIFILRSSSVILANILGVSTKMLKPEVWYYIELKFVIHDTTGAVEMRIDGETVINVTNVDTQALAGASYINSVEFRGSLPNWELDDVYILNTSGSVNNTFLGEISVETIFPNGAGSNTGFSVTGAASNYQAVDDATSNDNTDYVSSSVIGTKDTYGYPDLSGITQNVRGVQINPLVTKTGTTYQQAASVVRVTGVDIPQTAYPIANTYNYFPKIVETDPSTGTLWTPSGINSAEFGAQYTA